MKLATTSLAFCAIVALTACTSHTSTVETSSGSQTVTTSQDDKTVTVKTSDGTMAMGQSVDASKLGAPVYPGAAADQQGSITTSSDKGSSVIAAFKTADSFDKVYEYYKAQLPAGSEKMKMTTGNGSIAAFQVGDDAATDQITVQITADHPSQTGILITHVTKPASAATAAPPAATPSPESSG